jgi:hypothetical protein
MRRSYADGLTIRVRSGTDDRPLIFHEIFSYGNGDLL